MVGRSLFKWVVVVFGLVLYIAIAGGSLRWAEADLIQLQVFTSDFIDSTLGTSTPIKLPAPLFTFTKQNDQTILKITYQDTVGSVGGLCQYQVRVDGIPGDPRSVSSAPLLVAQNIVNTSLSSTGIFKGLTAGAHEISVWLRTVGATQCIRNSGGFTTTIIVEEMVAPGGGGGCIIVPASDTVPPVTTVTIVYNDTSGRSVEQYVNTTDHNSPLSVQLPPHTPFTILYSADDASDGVKRIYTSFVITTYLDGTATTEQGGGNLDFSQESCVKEFRTSKATEYPVTGHVRDYQFSAGAIDFHNNISTAPILSVHQTP